MIPPVNSLVRYDNPILVATSKGKKGEGPKAPAAVSQTEDILNSILPPRSNGSGKRVAICLSCSAHF